MVYVEKWKEFAEAAEALFVESPSKTRYSFKYREGVIVLKVTDDKTCLKYKTDRKQDLKNMQKMTARLMDMMAAKTSDSELQQDKAKTSSDLK